MPLKNPTEINALALLGKVNHSHSLTLFPAIDIPGKTPLFNAAELPADFVADHNFLLPAPSISILGLTQHEVVGHSFLRSISGEMFSDRLFLPNYLLGATPETVDPVYRDHLFGAGATGNGRHIELDQPCFVLLHSHLNYGHFLLEILPKLIIIGMLREMGVSFPVLLYHGAPAFIKDFVNYIVPDQDLVWMFPRTDVVRSPCFLIPSMMHDSYSFNAAMNLAVDYFVRRVLLGSVPQTGKRLYLSRRKFPQGWHSLENEAEVEALMSEIGFDVVHPETLPVTEQIGLYASANAMVSEYGSASHNSLFSPFGTKTLVINAINALQSRIAMLRQQMLAVQMPSDGKFRTDSREKISFRVEIPELRELCGRMFG